MKRVWRAFFPLWILGALIVPVRAQTTIVCYTFENTTTPIIGSSISSISWDSGATASYVGSSGSPYFSSQGVALSLGNMANGNSIQVTLDASGYQSINFGSFRVNGTLPAPVTWNLSYSLTGPSGTFTSVSTFTMSNLTAADSTTVPSFTFPSSANNNSSIVVSFVATTATKIGGGTPASGTIHLDNLSFSATAIPEPSTYAVIIGAIVLAGAAWQRRRQPKPTA